MEYRIPLFGFLIALQVSHLGRSLFSFSPYRDERLQGAHGAPRAGQQNSKDAVSLSKAGYAG